MLSGRPASSEEAVHSRNKTLSQRLARPKKRQSLSEPRRKKTIIERDGINVHTSQYKAIFMVIFKYKAS